MIHLAIVLQYRRSKQNDENLGKKFEANLLYCGDGCENQGNGSSLILQISKALSTNGWVQMVIS